MADDNRCFFVGLEAEIESILLDYVKIPSITATADENQACDFFTSFVSDIDYFKEHPNLYGTYAIKDDYHARKVSWAMLRGSGRGTVVLIHHNDVVSIEDYKLLKDISFSPSELEKKLFEFSADLSDEAAADLESGLYLWGHGVCDMKGGGAIQLALLKRYSLIAENLHGNIIVLGLPDEETMSAGMRSAVCLLEELKEQYGLQYSLMVNSEPHQRKEADRGIISTGSVGKIMPFVYVRGTMSHAGKSFEGFNPLGLLSEIVCESEMNTDFCDVYDKEAVPPPTWLFLHDNKKQYDVSMPLSAFGYFSLLTFVKQPSEVLRQLNTICKKSFEKVIQKLNNSYSIHCNSVQHDAHRLPWNVKVITYKQLLEKAETDSSINFVKQYQEKLYSLKKCINDGVSIGEAVFSLIDWIFEYIKDPLPTVVLGLIPPYYPHVSNMLYKTHNTEMNIGREVMDFAMREWSQHYDLENYYTGISDLSFSCISDIGSEENTLSENMPFLDLVYNIPFKEIEHISMPCINLGPWGKDFHKMTERVLKEDLFIRTPKIISFAIDKVLDTKVQ